MPSKCRDDRGNHALLQDRREHGQAPNAVDDALGIGKSSTAMPMGRRMGETNLGEKNGDADADGNSDEHGQERGDQRAGDGCQPAEFLRDRIPDLRPDERQTRCLDRGPGTGDKRQKMPANSTSTKNAQMSVRR